MLLTIFLTKKMTLVISKKNRPIASNRINFKNSLLILVLLLLSGLSISYFLLDNIIFFKILILYCILSFLYSLYLKKLYIFDCLLLSLLYFIRIFSGGELVNVEISFWLIAFSLFFFLSLAFVKRLVELNLPIKNKKINGRGYLKTDNFLILILAINSGYLSIFALILYMSSVKSCITQILKLWFIIFIYFGLVESIFMLGEVISKLSC